MLQTTARIYPTDLNVHYKFTGNYSELSQHFKGGFDLNQF